MPATPGDPARGSYMAQIRAMPPISAEHRREDEYPPWAVPVATGSILVLLPILAVLIIRRWR